MIGFGVLGFAIDLDGSDGRFLYSTNLVNLESNKKKKTRRRLKYR
jgi:hypothetical protein